MLNFNRIVPNCNGRYVLNVHGDIIDVEQGCVLPREGEHKSLVWMDWFKGTTHYEIGLVIVFTFHCPDIPERYRSWIIPIFNDGDPSNLSPANIHYKFQSPIPVDGNFFIVPYFTRFAISKRGVILDRKSGKTKKWYVIKPNEADLKNTRQGYRVTRIYRDDGTGTNISRHRALALALIDYPTNPHRLVVNHLDGIGGNDWIDNLEWTTHSGNTQHAYDNGLQPNNVRAVLVKDEETGNIQRYDSIAACCRSLGYSHTKISHRLRCNPGKTYSDGVAIKLDDESPWVEGRITAISTRNVMVHNVFTGDTVLVRDGVEAENLSGINSPTIRAHIDRQSTIPWKGFLFRRASDEEIIFPEFSKWQLELFKKDRSRSDVPGWLETDTHSKSKQLYLTGELAVRMGTSASQAERIAKQGTSSCGRFLYEKIEPSVFV